MCPLRLVQADCQRPGPNRRSRPDRRGWQPNVPSLPNAGITRSTIDWKISRCARRDVSALLRHLQTLDADDPIGHRPEAAQLRCHRNDVARTVKEGDWQIAP